MKYLNTLAIIGIIIFLSFNEPNLGGVRGGDRTGFNVMDGDNIAISSSTPMYDFVIDSDNATSTIMLNSATTTASACIIFEDTDSAGFTYCNYLNGTQTCSSTNICY